jgi:hypothetical protein
MSQIKSLVAGRTVNGAKSLGQFRSANDLSLVGFGLGRPLAAGDTDFIRRSRPGFWAGVRNKFTRLFRWEVPAGYEDETGFHFGIAPTPPLVDAGRGARPVE